MNDEFEEMIKKYNEQLKSYAKKIEEDTKKITENIGEMIKCDPPAAEEKPTVTPEETAGGILVIKASSAFGATPVGGVIVTVKGEEGEVIITTMTDESGNTPEIELPAPALALSLDENYTGTPYAKYTVTSAADGYFTIIHTTVPVFAGERSLLPVNMIPLPDGFEGDETIIIPEREEALSEKAQEE